MTTSRPEAAIARRSARSTVLGATVVAVGCAVTVAATAVTYVSTFPTEASRRQLARVTASGGGLEVLFGATSSIGSVGGYTFYKGYVFLTSIAAVWAVLITTRSLRGEEDTGRWHLLLSGATRPSRATAAVLVGLGASVLVVALGVLVGTAAATLDPKVRFGPGDVVVHAAALGLVPAVFTAVAALTSQIGRTRRVATGLALGAFGAAFLVRMVGDAGASTRWVRWLTPLGWSEIIAPLTDNDLRPLVPASLLIAALVGSAVLLAGRRDVGHGLVRARDSATMRPFGLRSAFGLTLRLERNVLWAWVIGGLVLGLAFGASAGVMLGDLPSGTGELLSRFGVTGPIVEQYFGLVMLWVGTVVALLAAGQIGAAAEEELRGRTVLILCGPVRRSAWLAGRLAVAAVALLVTAVLVGVALWVGARTQGIGDVGLPTLVAATTALVPVCLVALGVGALVLSVAPRVASAAVYVLVGWSLVVDLVGSLVDGLRWTARLGLLHYVALAPAQPVHLTTITVTTVVAVVLCGVAVVLFSRRDLRTA